MASEPREGSPIRTLLRQALRYGAVLPIVATAGGVAEEFYRLTGSDRLSSIFLAGVLLAAFLLGSGPAYFAATLAFLVYLFMVDPRYQFSFGSAEDFNALMVFLAVSVLIGMLTGRVRDEAARAKARQRINTALLDATREFSASSEEAFIRERLASHLARAARGQALVYDPIHTFAQPADAAGPAILATVREEVRRRDARAPARPPAPDGWRLRPLRADDSVLGVAAWRPDGGPLSEEETTLVEILADTGAAAISRARLAAGKAEAEARARTEDLRNALLSSISHDLRTPLAAILASATSLQEFGAAFDGPTRDDLLATIHEESERLDGVVANLLNMSRLEAGALTIQHAAFNVPEVVRRTLQRHTRGAQRTVSTVIDPGTPEAMGDPVLFEQALGNVVDNALRYSPPDAPVGVMVRGESDAVVVEVWDEGSGVPETETDQVFEKFYRAANSGHVPGTGLGLSITRGLLASMGGDASLRNRNDGVGGAVVRLRLQGAGA